MSAIDRYTRLTTLGWILFACLGVVVALGADSTANGVAFTLIGIAMAAWVWFRRSRPALIVSLVIGGLHTVEQIAYIVAGVRDSDWGLVLADTFGLAGGLIITVGSLLALRAGRQASQLVDTPG